MKFSRKHGALAALITLAASLAAVGLVLFGLVLPAGICVGLGALLALAFPALAWWQYAIALYVLWFLLTLVSKRRN